MAFEDVLKFWFEECERRDWWRKKPDFDAMVKERFLGVYEAAAVGACWTWRETAKGRLAEIIVLDQFPRNMFRDTPRAFEADNVAMVLAQEAVSRGILAELETEEERGFLLMPYQHSEDSRIQVQSVKLFAEYANADSHKFALAHQRVIDQFGRYPHRNEILGRESTAEEIEFLSKPGSRF